MLLPVFIALISSWDTLICIQAKAALEVKHPQITEQLRLKWIRCIFYLKPHLDDDKVVVQGARVHGERWGKMSILGTKRQQALMGQYDMHTWE